MCALHMSAFGGKADMTGCGSPLSRSLFVAKRTWPLLPIVKIVRLNAAVHSFFEALTLRTIDADQSPITAIALPEGVAP
jgi:hypothetical protein